MSWLRLKRPDGGINWPAIPVFIGIVLVALVIREEVYFAFHV